MSGAAGGGRPGAAGAPGAGRGAAGGAAGTFAVGIDLGGTNMQVGVVDDALRLLGDDRRKTHAELGRDAVLDRIVEAVHDACEEAGIDVGSCAGVGIAAPGAVEIATGTVVEAPNLGWTQAPVRELLAERLPCPVHVDNDVNAAAWGEHLLGAGRGRGDLLAVWVGTGVGGGLVLGGRLHHGDLSTAGEIGHTRIRPDAPDGRRTVEDLCSRTGMLRLLEAAMPDHPDSVLHRLEDASGRLTTTRQIVDAAEAADPLTLRVLDEAARLLGVAIANQVTMLAISTVVIGGGMTEVLGEPWLEKIRESFRREVFPARNQVCELRMTELRENAGLLGAAMIALRTGTAS